MITNGRPQVDDDAMLVRQLRNMMLLEDQMRPEGAPRVLDEIQVPAVTAATTQAVAAGSSKSARVSGTVAT